MLGRQDHERRSEQRVRSGREDAQLVATGLVFVGCDLEVDLGALGPADPVRLLDADRLRPVDAGEVEQFVGVRGRPQEPLLEVALLDQGAAAPAMPIDAFDLLARQRPVVRAPVDRRQRAIGEPGFHELQEQPLVPAVVGRIGGDDLLRPGERRAHRPELATHVLDVLHRPGERVSAALDGGVLRRQPEGIEADREEHVVAVHPPEPGEGVTRGDDVPVTDVEVARRVRIHRQQVVLGLGRVRQVGLVQPDLVPALLPARLDGGRVVAFQTGARFGGHDPIVSIGPRSRAPALGSRGPPWPG